MLNQNFTVIDREKRRTQRLIETLSRPKTTYKTQVKLRLLCQQIFSKPVAGWKCFSKKREYSRTLAKKEKVRYNHRVGLERDREANMLSKRSIKAISLLLFLAVLILSTECYGEPKYIKKKTGYRYGLVERFGQYESQLKEFFIIEYNRNGNLTIFVRYDPKGEVLSKTTRQYNEKGYATEEDVHGPSGELQRKVMWEYDERGNDIVGALYDSEGNLESKRFSKYNEKGKLISSSSYDSEGKLSSKGFHNYDQDGNEIEWTYYTYILETESRSRIIYMYDHRGKRIVRASFGSEGVFKGLNFHKYDENGNQIEEVKYGSKGELWLRHVHKYNENGDTSEYLFYTSEGLSSKTVYEYNEQNRLSKEVRYIYKFAFGKMQEIPSEETVYEYEYY